MTNLEIILIVALWILYGAYIIKNTDEDAFSNQSEVNAFQFFAVLISPIFLVCRMLYGALKKYK